MDQRLCIFGEVLFDVFPDGQQVLGGAPFNVAWHLQAFGQHPLFISRVGDDEQGRSIRGSMQDWGMDSGALQTDSQLSTGRVTIEFDDGEPHYDIVSPCAYDVIEPNSSGLQNCHLLYHGSLALRHQQSAMALEHLIESNPSSVFLDVNLRPPWWTLDRVQGLIRQAQWVKLNDDEFDLLYPGHDALSNPLQAFIEDFGLQGLILTHGQAGAEVRQENGGHFQVRPENDIRVVDTVGAGDAFTSVMIMGILNDWPMQTALERAQSFASNIVGRRGATVNDPVFYHNVLSDWR